MWDLVNWIRTALGLLSLVPYGVLAAGFAVFSSLLMSRLRQPRERKGNG